MSALSLAVGQEPELSVEQIESHLIEAANRHHLEERNIAYWLLEIDRRALQNSRVFVAGGLCNGARRHQAAQGLVPGLHRRAAREPTGHSRGV